MKTEWHCAPSGIIFDKNQIEPIAHMNSAGSSMQARKEMLKNGEFIVRACNAHDDLVEALKLLVNGHSIDAAAMGRAALAKAESK